jgi:hypothetical protein
MKSEASASFFKKGYAPQKQKLSIVDVPLRCNNARPQQKKFFGFFLQKRISFSFCPFSMPPSKP